MWYTRRQANTFICTPTPGGRAGHPGGRSPVGLRLYRTPLPNSPCQCCGPDDHHHCARPALHRADGAQCAACVPPARVRGAAAAIVASTHHGDDLRYGDLRGAAGAVAPEFPDLRQTHQPLDACLGRGGEFRPGADPSPGQRRSHPGGSPPVGSRLETRQTLDHQARSRVGSKKKRRDQLIQRAHTWPTWVLGFGDEVWWSRLAQLNQHCWTDPEATSKLQELARPTKDTDPKALACYGLLV